MGFRDYARQIRSIGRELTPDSLGATRRLLEPLVPMPDPAEVRVERDVAYGSHERHRLDVFTPAGGFEPQRPLLIFVHGGGFVTGDKHTEGSPFYSNIGVWAVRNGCNAVAMTYRLAPQHPWPAGIEDIHQVFRYLRHAGADHGLQSDCVFLMGQSAGAAHAASYVAHPELYAPFGHGVTGLALLSGLYDYTSFDVGPMGRAYLGEDTETYESRSSLQGLLKARVPMLVTLSEYDPPIFEQQGLQLLTAWQQHYQQLPHFVYASGQNHLSIALSLGLEGDLLGPQLRAFIEEYSRQR